MKAPKAGWAARGWGSLFKCRNQKKIWAKAVQKKFLLREREKTSKEGGPPGWEDSVHYHPPLGKADWLRGDMGESGSKKKNKTEFYLGSFHHNNLISIPFSTISFIQSL